MRIPGHRDSLFTPYCLLPTSLVLFKKIVADLGH
jgi:hypothetical protein